VLPFAPSWAELVFHLFVVRSQQPDSPRLHDEERRIRTLSRHPVAPRLQEAFRELSMKQGCLPICEASPVAVLDLPAVLHIGLFTVEKDVSTIREYTR